MRVERHPITDRASWLQLRTQDVTASDVSAVCGVSLYRSPLSVWAEKLGLVPAQVDNPTLRRGRWLEPAAFEALKETKPDWDLRRSGVYLRAPEIRLGATPDGVARDPEREGIGVVQAKTVRRDVFERHWTDLGDGRARAPLHYQLQALTEAMLVESLASEPTWAVVAALVLDFNNDAELYLCDVPRHEGAEGRILEAVGQFWQAIEQGIRPPVSFDLDAELMAQLYPEPVKGPPLDLSQHNRIRELLDRRQELEDEIKDLRGEKDEIDTEIKAILGTHEVGELPNYRITWKLTQSKGYTVEPKSYRRLTITPKKG